MVFSEEDKNLVKFYRITRNLRARKIIKLFSEKHWTLSGVRYLIDKIDKTGSFARRIGSGRPRSGRTPAIVDKVEELILRLRACVAAGGGHFEYKL